MTRYALNPAMPVLSRPDGVVQVGWDPRRAVLVRPPSGLSTAALGHLLRVLHTGATLAEVQELAADVDDSVVAGLIAALVDAGVVTAMTPPRPRTRSASIRIHGRGPLSDLLTSALRCSGARITHSNQRHAAVTAETADLVVLSDSLAAEPKMLRELHAARIPHLQVRVRDGAGLVGPLVLPGVTSCLRCADLHRGRPGRGLARGRRPAARHRRQCRPGHRAGHRGAGAQPGRPRHRGRARRGGTRPRAAATVDPGHHAGIRRQHRLDRVPQMVAASAMHAVLADFDCCQTVVESSDTSWMMDG